MDIIFVNGTHKKKRFAKYQRSICVDSFPFLSFLIKYVHALGQKGAGRFTSLPLEDQP